MRPPEPPLWLKLAYGAGFLIVAVSYWFAYGPSNYLWLSDIAFACTTAAVICGNRLPASMAAIGVLPLELGWVVDFLAGGALIGIAAYMFDPELSLYLRALSAFHLALPPTLLWLLWRYGYDRRALPLQMAVGLTALIASYVFVAPDKNINWVYSPGAEPQHALDPSLYFSLVMMGIGVLVPVAMHLALVRVFRGHSG